MPASTYSRRTRLFAVAVIVALGAVVVAGALFAMFDGTGPSSKGLADRYEQVRNALRQESDALRAEGSATPAEERALADVLRVYERLRAATERARAGYAALDVPDGMRQAKRRLVEVVSERVSILRRLINAAEVGDQATAAQAVRELLAKAQSLNAAEAEMDKRIAECGPRCR